MHPTFKNSFGVPVGHTAYSRKRATVTLTIIILNVLVYLITSYNNFFLESNDYWASIGGFIPSLISEPSQWYRLITSMFLHADLFHILFNMYFLYTFGRAVEEALGETRFLLLYFVSGIIASIFHAAFSFIGGPLSYVVPAIGASGAISGILGAYLILYPGTSLVVGTMLFMFPIFLPIKASYYLIFWFATQILYGYTKAAGSTAVFAHAGGFIAGIALLPLLVDRARLSQLKFIEHIRTLPYLLFGHYRTEGLSTTTKIILASLIIPLLIGSVFTLVLPLGQGAIKSVLVQYNYEGTSFSDYLVVQLPNVESYLSDASFDETKILLARLYAAKLLYNKTYANRELNLSNLSLELPVNVVLGSLTKVVNVNTTITYFKGSYDNDGFLSYGEGNLSTQLIIIQGYEIYLSYYPISYNFKISSSSISLSNIIRYTGIVSFVVAVTALITVFKKDKELTLVSEYY
ncbi:rhomboid family intramembrane serine protease [archaeon]|nr:rhomboid family intramembrane serine protease [archaeon]